MSRLHEPPERKEGARTTEPYKKQERIADRFCSETVPPKKKNSLPRDAHARRNDRARALLPPTALPEGRGKSRGCALPSPWSVLNFFCSRNGFQDRLLQVGSALLIIPLSERRGRVGKPFAVSRQLPTSSPLCKKNYNCSLIGKAPDSGAETTANRFMWKGGRGGRVDWWVAGVGGGETEGGRERESGDGGGEEGMEGVVPALLQSLVRVTRSAEDGASSLLTFSFFCSDRQVQRQDLTGPLLLPPEQHLYYTFSTTSSSSSSSRSSSVEVIFYAFPSSRTRDPRRSGCLR